MKFTQEIKDKWLKALKSGEYEQFNGQLRNPENHKQCCCIGVLCNVLNEPINEVGMDNLNKDIYEQLHNNITAQLTEKLWRINDKSYEENDVRDYSEVIPIIEQLPVSN